MVFRRHRPAGRGDTAGIRSNWPPGRIIPLLTVFLLLGLLWVRVRAVSAQTETDTGEATPAAESTPERPQVHVIQQGETLFSIATLYGTTVEALQLVNNITDAGLIFAGQELIIPGAVGESVYTTHAVQFGDTLADLALAFATTPEEIANANRLVRADSLYAGQALAVISYSGSPVPVPLTGSPHIVQPGDTLLGIAAEYGTSAVELAQENGLVYPARVFPGMRLRVPGASPFHSWPAGLQTIRVHPVPWTQGDTVSIYLETESDTAPLGRLGDQTLQFAPHDAGFAALVGIDAFTEPGLYTLQIETADAAGERQLFEQPVAVRSAGFLTQTITLPETMSALLDPQVRAREDAFLAPFFEQFTPTRYWEGLWQRPVSTTVVTAGYGGARSYNGGPFDIYHTGIDFGGTTGTQIVAPANGIVVFSGPLQLRGNSVLIDHGLGVVTGYYHLDQITVAVGDAVVPGQVIGYGGSTGLSTGPHLHWDVRVRNVPVNGDQWLREPFP